MALSKTITTEHGVSIANAYIRVEAFSISKTSAQGHAAIYADPTKAPFQARPFSFDYQLDGENPIKQAYLHLKALPEFAGAIDC